MEQPPPPQQSTGAVADTTDVCEVDVPIFIELKNSSYGSGDLGAYCSMPLNADQFLGSYKGKNKKSMAQCADPEYVWTILSSRQMPLFYIDATDARDSNWLRFIRSTSDASKYNVICMQQNQQINYFTFRDIKVGEELVTFLAGKKKKRPKGHQTKTYKLYEPLSVQSARSGPAAASSQNGPKILGNGAKAVTPRRNEDSAANSGMLTRSTRLYRRNEDFMSAKKKGKAKNEADADDDKSKIETKRLIISISCDQTDHFKMNSFSLKPLSSEADEPNSSIYCLLKCDMCPFSCVALEASLDAATKLNAQLKRHILVEHVNQELFGDERWRLRDEAELVSLQVLNSLLSRIESDSCNNAVGAHAGGVQVDRQSSSQSQFYRCARCAKLFSGKNDLVRHLISRHAVNANTLKCPKCDKSFDKTRTYDCLKHLASKHEDEWLKDTRPVSITSDHDFVESNRRMNWTDYFGEGVSPAIFSLESLLVAGNSEDGGAAVADDMDDASSQTSSTASSSGTASSSSNKKRKGAVKDKKVKTGGGEVTNQEDEEEQENETATVSQSATPRTWTCQLCKKQFEQRVELSKHQCIELHLKQLKKKKEMRKKKWREAHWKRKIDLSYIETTSLTQFSQIIADNLSFCIDGTSEDLRAYTREVKDYLNTELGDETQMQMLMKHCFPELNDRVLPPPPPPPPPAPAPSRMLQAARFVDTNVVRRANSYFIDCVHTAANDVHTLPPVNSKLPAGARSGTAPGATLTTLSVFQCKSCRLRCKTLSELISHQRQVHGMQIKTTFDCYNKPPDEAENSAPPVPVPSESLNWLSSNTNAISPVGYLGCDPFAYVFNLHWDQTIQKRCEHCNGVFNRQKYRKHVLSCSSQAKTAEVHETAPPPTEEEENEDSNDQETEVDVEMVDSSQPEPAAKVTTGVPEVDRDVRQVCADLVDSVVARAELDAVVMATAQHADDTTSQVLDTSAAETEKLPVMESLATATAESGGLLSMDDKSIMSEMTKSVSSPETDAAAASVIKNRTRRKRSAVDDLNASENLILNKKRQVSNPRSSYDSENFVYFHQTKTSPTSAGGQQAAKTACPPPQDAPAPAPASAPPGRSLRGSAAAAKVATRQSPRAAKMAASSEQTQVHSSSPLSSKTTRNVQARHLVLTPEALPQEPGVKVSESTETEPKPPAAPSQRVSARIRRKPQEFSELVKPAEPKFRRCVTSPSGESSKVKAESVSPAPAGSPVVASQPEAKKDVSPTLTAINNKLVRIELIDGDRKIYVCTRCGLEFTSPNSAIRHQEKSCLRVFVINLKLAAAAANHAASQHTRMCPICSCVFNNTHRLSVHIYKYHRALLGSATTPPSAEAKRLHEVQLKKSKTIACDQVIVEENEGESENVDVDETPFNSTKDIDSLLNASNVDVKEESSAKNDEEADLDATLDDADSMLAAPEPEVKAQETEEAPRLRKRPGTSSEEKKRPSNEDATLAPIAYKGAVTRKKSNSLSSSSSASNINQAAAAEEPTTAASIASRALRTSSRHSTDSNKNAKLNSTF